KRYFADISKGQSSIAPVAVVESSQKGERHVVVKYAGRQEVVQVAYHAPAITDGDAPAMAVLEKLLNVSYSGRLKAKLVLPKICMSASAAFEAKKDPGLFTITCSAVPGVGETQVLEAVDGTINQLRAQALADSEVRRARNQAEFAYVSEQDGPYKIAFNLGYFDTLTDWQAAHTWTERLRSVTASDLQRVTKRYLNPDNRVIGWLSASSQTKPSTTKPAPGGESPPVKEAPKAPHTRQAMGVSMTGYKADELLAVTVSAADDVQTNVPTTVVPSLPPAPKIGHEKAVLVETKRIHQRVLKNGVTVIVFESHLSPMVEVLGAVRAGDVFDPVGKKGMSALTAAYLNCGSAKRSRSQQTLLQEDWGLSPQAMLKFDSGRDVITFRTRCLARDLSNQLSVVAEVLATPVLQEADIDKAKQEVVAFIKHQEDTVPMRVHRAVLRKLLSSSCAYYPDDLIERVKSIMSLKISDVKSFHSQYVAPNATTVILAGDITVDEAMLMLESSVGAWPTKANHLRPTMQATSRRVFRTFIPTGASSEVAVCLGQLVDAQRNHPEYGQLLVADCAVSGHPMIARLKQHSEGETSLVDWRTRFESLGGALVWLLSSSMSAEEAPQAVSSILAEVKKLVKLGLRSDELSEIKRYLVGAIPVRTMGTLTAVCDGVLESHLQCGEADCLARTLSAVVSTSTESVNKIIRTTLKPDQATLVIAGSAKAIKSIREKVFTPQVSGN
ncbi:MAG: insulinase family protein, partial [Candidatus Melainabacteria bacterium]|nr:insulinase family protein [Candidatus Melainabacteria bacterium]